MSRQYQYLFRSGRKPTSRRWTGSIGSRGERYHTSTMPLSLFDCLPYEFSWDSDMCALPQLPHSTSQCPTVPHRTSQHLTSPCSPQYLTVLAFWNSSWMHLHLHLEIHHLASDFRCVSRSTATASSGSREAFRRKANCNLLGDSFSRLVVLSQTLWFFLKLCDSFSHFVALSQTLWLFLKLCDSSSNSVTLSQTVWLFLKLCDSFSYSVTLSQTLWLFLKLCDSFSNSLSRSVGINNGHHFESGRLASTCSRGERQEGQRWTRWILDSVRALHSIVKELSLHPELSCCCTLKMRYYCALNWAAIAPWNEMLLHLELSCYFTLESAVVVP